MPKSQTPTLEDVSREAGVSTATVSRCLNTPNRVTQDKRERVLAAVQKLGYSPNFGARALAAKRTHTVGAVIPTMENAVFARGIDAFQQELSKHGVTLLLACSSYRADLENEQIRMLTARGADGLLLIGHDRDEEIYRFLAQHSVPVLTAWVFDIEQPRPSIGFNNKLAMQQLVHVVLELGHRRIGVIAAHQRGNDRARARVEGIRAALSDKGLSPEALHLVEVPYGIETGAAAFFELMSGASHPTVVICGNDVLAAGALRQARQMGLRVPGDVSITGFDDIDIATLVDPALTTVHVPHREMGRQAARLLIDMVNGEADPGRTELPTRLCLRASLGSPPESGV